MQICVWRLVGKISFSQIAFVGEPFSLITETRFLRGEKASGEPRLTAFNIYSVTVPSSLSELSSA